MLVSVRLWFLLHSNCRIDSYEVDWEYQIVVFLLGPDSLLVFQNEALLLPFFFLSFLSFFCLFFRGVFKMPNFDN